MTLGIGVALIVVAAFHLLPAFTTGEIPTTTSRRIRRDERPSEFWGTCIVMGAAAALGTGLLLGELLIFAAS